MGMRDEGREITVIETNGGGGFKWFFYGAMLGAGLGILFAPKPGTETRDELRRRARRLRDDAGERFDELADEVETRGRRIKGAVEEWADDIVGEVRDGKRELKHTASSARDDLERRLSEARMRRRATAAADGVAELDDDEDEFDDELDEDDTNDEVVRSAEDRLQ